MENLSQTNASLLRHGHPSFEETPWKFIFVTGLKAVGVVGFGGLLRRFTHLSRAQAALLASNLGLVFQYATHLWVKNQNHAVTRERYSNLEAAVLQAIPETVENESPIQRVNRLARAQGVVNTTQAGVASNVEEVQGEQQPVGPTLETVESEDSTSQPQESRETAVVGSSSSPQVTADQTSSDQSTTTAAKADPTAKTVVKEDQQPSEQVAGAKDTGDQQTTTTTPKKKKSGILSFIGLGGSTETSDPTPATAQQQGSESKVEETAS